MIGGSDKVLWVDENAPAADLILRVVRQHWPKFVFQDADEDQPLDTVKSSGLTKPAGREFFLYRCPEASQDWLQLGATENNKNTMIHVILGNRRKPDLGLRSVTLVSDDWTDELGVILADVRMAFDAFNLKALLEISSGRQYWLKPIGLPGHPMEDRQPEVFPEHELEVHFARNPAAVAQGDVLIAWRTGAGKLIYVAQRLPGGPYPTEDATLPEWVRKRYPLFYKAKNLTPAYGMTWNNYRLKPFTLVKKYNSDHPDGQPVNLGALQHGADKLCIDRQFAEFLIGKILQCEETSSVKGAAHETIAFSS